MADDMFDKMIIFSRDSREKRPEIKYSDVLDVIFNSFGMEFVRNREREPNTNMFTFDSFVRWNGRKVWTRISYEGMPSRFKMYQLFTNQCVMQSEEAAAEWMAFRICMQIAASSDRCLYILKGEMESHYGWKVGGKNLDEFVEERFQIPSWSSINELKMKLELSGFMTD